MLHPRTIEFLEWLKDFNDKKFFDLYRPLYDQIRKDFVKSTQTLIQNISKFDDTISWVNQKDCIFRINRDIRFSHNKTPYKTNLGTYIALWGKKSSLAGYYIHIQPWESFFWAGIYMPSTPIAKAIRDAIYKNFPQFKKIISNKKFLFEFEEPSPYRWSLKVLPKEYEKSHPSIPYLKMKDRLVMVPLTDKEVLSPDFEKKILELSKLAYPFNEFLDGVVLGMKKKNLESKEK